MKKETLTIIIGTLITLLVLALVIFTMYKIDEKKTSTPKDKTAIKEVENNKDNEDNNTTPNDNNQNKDDDNTNINNNDKPNTNDANNKVTLYLFHGSTCPACQKAIERINTYIIGKYDYLEIKTFEVWHNEDNSKLMSKVAEALNVEAKYIPFMIIGDYSTTTSKDNEDFLKEEITGAHTNSNYEDIVAKVISENKDLNPKFEILK